jgi:UDP-N-acetyl-D-glucosamine dehydrogenase
MMPSLGKTGFPSNIRLYVALFYIQIQYYPSIILSTIAVGLVMDIESLLRKIVSNEAVVGVVGLGYVGLPLSLAFSKKFQVIGYDKSPHAIDSLSKGRSTIIDIPDESIKQVIDKSFKPTLDPADLASCDFKIICVPTPLKEDKEPDLSYIRSASMTVAQTLHKGQYVILESTSYPGTTRDVMTPILETTSLRAGIDFGVAFSPERIDPGNKQFTVETIPKIVGGINEPCTELAVKLYEQIIDKVVPVSNPETAEAAKMMENIFRNVNIALVNELSIIFSKMGIDTWEVIKAASTKPYGYMPFSPGPGVGGHCIPLDPYYMSYISKRYGFIPRFIELSGNINDFMRVYAINLVEQGLRRVGQRLFRSEVAVLGLAYKRNIDDSRESPSLKVIEELTANGVIVRAYDPYINKVHVRDKVIESAPSLGDALSGADCALFMVDHDFFKNISLAEYAGTMRNPVIVDCKNIFETPPGNILYLGIGKANKLGETTVTQVESESSIEKWITGLKTIN